MFLLFCVCQKEAGMVLYLAKGTWLQWSWCRDLVSVTGCFVTVLLLDWLSAIRILPYLPKQSNSSRCWVNWACSCWLWVSMLEWQLWKGSILHPLSMPRRTRTLLLHCAWVLTHYMDKIDFACEQVPNDWPFFCEYVSLWYYIFHIFTMNIFSILL